MPLVVTCGQVLPTLAESGQSLTVKNSLFWLCVVVAAPFWLVVVTMGGLEVVQQAKGLSTENTPRTLALYALVPAVLPSVVAYGVWRSGDGSPERRGTRPG